LNPVDSTDFTVYNVPLVIVQQVGILAALAWVFLIIYSLIKSKWKYAFIVVIALGLFDSYMWAQLGIFVVVLLGVASLNEIKTDLIFRYETV
jgi:hypothetical protein